MELDAALLFRIVLAVRSRTLMPSHDNAVDSCLVHPDVALSLRLVLCSQQGSSQACHETMNVHLVAPQMGSWVSLHFKRVCNVWALFPRPLVGSAHIVHPRRGEGEEKLSRALFGDGEGKLVLLRWARRAMLYVDSGN